MSIFNDVCVLYGELYKQSTQRNEFVYKPADKDKKIILKFLSYLKSKYKKHEINEEFLIAYFEFQFSRYAGIITPHGRNSIMINWILGQKAIEAYEKRNLKEKYIIRWKIRRDNIKLTVKKSELSKPVLYRFLKKVNPLEEEMKLRFLNKKAGFNFCRDMTTLFNPNSDICVKKCGYKESCIKRLKNSYPNLYKLRFPINGKNN